MIRIAVIGALLIATISANGLTRIEKDDFAQKVEAMSDSERRVYLALSGAGFIVTGATGLGLSGITAVFGSLPIVSAFQFMVVDMAYGHGSVLDLKSSGGSTAPVVYAALGGLPSVVTDLSSAAYDYRDFKLDQPLVDDMKIAYAETFVVVNGAFGESGYCRDHWDRFNILWNFKSKTIIAR